MPHSTAMSYLHQNGSGSGIENVSIIFYKKKGYRHRKRKKGNNFTNIQQNPLGKPTTSFTFHKNGYQLLEHYSMPELVDQQEIKKLKVRSSDMTAHKSDRPYDSKFTVDFLSEYRITESPKPFNNVFPPAKWKVYRCQLSSADDTCCCACNSDAMFEVMKSLYDCYKKKDCDHCNCILCGHLPREERKLGEMRKAGKTRAIAVGDEKKAKKKVKKEKAEKTKVPTEPKKITEKEKIKQTKVVEPRIPLEGKTPQEREKIIRGLAQMGQPLPEAKTASEKKLIDNVRADLGLPEAPKSPSMKDKYTRAQDAGMITPLEGKTPAQKEKILKGLVDAGIPLPEGRTPSEKKLIEKVKPTKKVSKVVSAKIRKPKEERLLVGKSPSQKEKILKAQADAGIPLPEGRTPSEQAIIKKIKESKISKPVLEKADKKTYKTTALAGPGRPALPPDKAQKLDKKTAKNVQEAKGRTSDECICDLLTPETQRSLLKTPSVKGRVPSKIDAEKLKAAKAAGLLVPLEDKTPQEKEKIIRGLAQKGLPLPEVKTASEKKIIDKVRADVGLPPEPKTPSMKEKYAKAQATGIITPLEGKTPAQQEKILKALTDAGIPLPEGRTPSEKVMINKIKAGTEPPAEKLRKAKAAGLKPLEDKTQQEKEKNIRGLAQKGLPLPEAKTASEKKIIDKVRADVGLPPEPKTPSMKEKYAKAQATGIITPLEGKTPAQQEKILKALTDAGIPLPEGRTPSEKVMINKIKAGTEPPAEKLRKAKAAGLKPLEGKTPAEKEKLLKTQAKAGVPLPEGRTASEKAIIQKIKAEAKKSKTMLEEDKKKSKAIAGPGRPALSPDKAQKLDKKTAKNVQEAKGRSSDECICDLLTPETKRAPLQVPSAKLKPAKAAGVLTPLESKTPKEKEKILRGLAQKGLPLPEAKTASEKKIIDKVRADLGLPPEAKTPSIKEKHAKAQAAGVVIPIEGKTPAEKEKILRAQADAGIPLHEGRTLSEKAIIKKIKAETKKPKIVAEKEDKKAHKTTTAVAGPGRPALPPDKAQKLDKKTAKNVQEAKGRSSDECICDLLTPETKRAPHITPSVKDRVPSKMDAEKLKTAKAAGVVTPLEDKTQQEKEKKIKDLAKQGLPLPDAKTASEKKIIDKVKADMGLPPEPKSLSMKEKHAKAPAAGVTSPLEGKSPAEKEKILKAQAKAGIPLPEGRTASEKAIIKKVKAETIKPKPVIKEDKRKSKGIAVAGPGRPALPPDKAQKLNKKTAKNVQEAKGRSSDECICDLLTPESKRTPLQVSSEKLKAAKAAGLLTPLEGKTPAEKEKILKAQADAGIPLPEGRTPSEKAIITKIKAAPVASTEKLKKAKAGLLTPLEGKTAPQREKVIRDLAAQGLPLPEPKSNSEKKIIAKVRKELGLPPEPKTAAEKAKYDKALAAGVIAPLNGKTLPEKEKILQAQADMGVPLPEGRTPSENLLIKKIRASPTKKTKSKRVEAVAAKPAKDVGVSAIAKTKGGIEEKYEDIAKTTTCERGCGCDKKKIRFKHSYVKIRVTSPDISSLCPCPNECIPGVKGGVFTDNEGIKVTVGSAVGVPSFCKENAIEINHRNVSCINDSNTFTNSSENTTNSTEENKISFKTYSKTDNVEIIHKRLLCTDSEQSLNTFEALNYYNVNSECGFMLNSLDNEISDKSSASRYLVTCSESDTPSLSVSWSSLNGLISSKSSIILIVDKTESSLSFSSESSASIGTISVISIHQSSITSSQYLDYSQSTNGISEDKFFTREIDYAVDSKSESIVSEQFILNEESEVPTMQLSTRKTVTEFLVYRLSQANLADTKNKGITNEFLSHDYEPTIVINYVNSEQEINEVLGEVIANRQFLDNSSLFIILPTSEENINSLSETTSSTICIRLPKNYFFKNEPILKKVEEKVLLKKRRPQGLTFITKGKGNKNNQPRRLNYQYGQRYQETNGAKLESNILSKNYQTRRNERRCGRATENKANQIENMEAIITHRAIGTYTSQQRLKFCPPKKPSSPDECSRSKKVMKLSAGYKDASEIQKLMISRQSDALDLSQDADDGGKVATKKASDSNLFMSANITSFLSQCPSDLQLVKHCSCPSITKCPPPAVGPCHCIKSVKTKNNKKVNSISCRGLDAPSGSDLQLVNKCSCQSITKCPPPTVEPCNCIKSNKKKNQKNVKIINCKGPGNLPDKWSDLQFDKQCSCPSITKYSPSTVESCHCTKSNKNQNNFNIISCRGPVIPPVSCRQEPDRCSCFPVKKKSKKSRKEEVVKCPSNQNVTCMCYDKKKGKNQGSDDRCPCKEPKPGTLTPIYLPSPCIRSENGPKVVTSPSHSGEPSCAFAPAPRSCVPKVSFEPLLNIEPAAYSLPPPCVIPPPQSRPVTVPCCAYNGKDFCSQCNIKEKNYNKKDKSCACSSTKRRRKNCICECPPEPEEEEEEFIDEKEARRIKSVLTQTTSGFKFKVKKSRKPPVQEEKVVEEEISFEYALRYLDLYDAYTRNLKRADKQKKADCECAPKSNNCICELDLESEAVAEEEVPQKGLKVIIDGRGSASSGLAGICCNEKCLFKRKK